MSSCMAERSDMTSISLDMHSDFKFPANLYIAVALLLLNTWLIVFLGIPYHQQCQIAAFSKQMNETYRGSVNRMTKAQMVLCLGRGQNRLSCSLQYTSSINSFN